MIKNVLYCCKCYPCHWCTLIMYDEEEIGPSRTTCPYGSLETNISLNRLAWADCKIPQANMACTGCVGGSCNVIMVGSTGCVGNSMKGDRCAYKGGAGMPNQWVHIPVGKTIHDQRIHTRPA